MTVAFALWIVLVTGPFLAWLSFRPGGYKRTPLDAPPGPEWRRTAERFVDPASGELVEVFYRDRDGERAYVRTVPMR